MKIEKNIPMPRRGYDLPFEQMEIGDSFILPDNVSPGYARTLIFYIQKKLRRKFSLRRVGEEYRCWRIS